MITGPNPLIMTGAELDDLSDAELIKLLDKEVLFARMASEHKLRLVSAFQQRGDVVAVTGDGVNDAPALRKSDVGISMGIVGTDVAKEAADIILTHDDFGAIVTAIEEGRGVFDNIRKFITYIFSSNIPELMPFIVTASLPLVPLALTVRQILAIDMGTDLFPALALGTEKPEPDVMSHPPRPRNQPLLDKSVMWRAFWLGSIEAALCFAGFIAIFTLSGLNSKIGLTFLPVLNIPDDLRLHLTLTQAILLASTVYHAGVVTAQAGNALACRSEHVRSSYLGWLSNSYLLGGIFIELVAIVGIIYIPFLAKIFKHVPIPGWMWIGLGSYALIIYSIEWVRKSLLRRLKRRRRVHQTEIIVQEDNQ
jgi:Ca2+-transporting ATPase